jgi:hypothetical protein
VHAEQTQAPHLLDQVLGEDGLLVPGVDVGPDAVIHELADLAAQVNLLLAKQVIDVEVVVGKVGHRCAPIGWLSLLEWF